MRTEIIILGTNSNGDNVPILVDDSGKLVLG